MNSWNKLSKLVRLLVRRERDIHPAIIAPATYVRSRRRARGGFDPDTVGHSQKLFLILGKIAQHPPEHFLCLAVAAADRSAFISAGKLVDDHV
jgi:hypothetical protein